MLQMFADGSAVEHKVKIPGSACKFSVWYNADGYPKDVERIDQLGRSFEATQSQWDYLMRWRPAAMTPAGRRSE